eukprot:81640_1
MLQRNEKLQQSDNISSSGRHKSQIDQTQECSTESSRPRWWTAEFWVVWALANFKRYILDSGARASRNLSTPAVSDSFVANQMSPSEKKRFNTDLYIEQLRRVSSFSRMEDDCITAATRRRTVMDARGRFFDHFQRELVLLKQEWPYILVTLLGIAVHSTLTNVAYYFHQPGPRLPDIGFALLPELPAQLEDTAEIFIAVMAISTALFIISGFFQWARPRPLFAIHMVSRLGVSISLCTLLRCITFLVTGLPGPAEHCRPGSEVYNPPVGTWEVLFRFDATRGCGDLLFSSHMLMTLNCTMLFQHYCKDIYPKIFMWSISVCTAFVILAARHHYSVDVLVAWYVTILVWNQYARSRPDGAFPSLPYDKVRLTDADKELRILIDPRDR